MDRSARVGHRQTRRDFLRGSLVLPGLGLSAFGVGVLGGCGMHLPPAWPAASGAKVTRVGLLSTQAIDPSPEGTAFRQALREQGHVDGQNIAFLPRFALEKEALKAAVDELIGSKIDVLVAFGNEAIRTAREATGSIPIIMVDSTNPVGEGFVASLARPGGNLTGLTSFAAELSAKRLELLKEAVPGLSRVGLLWISRSDDSPEWSEFQSAARILGIQLHSISASRSTLYDGFTRVVVAQVGGVIALAAEALYSLDAQQRRLAEMAVENGLPTMFELPVFVSSGGLMSYGPSRVDQFRRAAGYVDRVLKGAKAADLPVEQPTTFDFVVNLETARALKLALPQSILMQATQLIE